MGNIGEPVRRYTIVPIKAPVSAPEGPRRALPVEPSPQAPAKQPDPKPAKVSHGDTDIRGHEEATAGLAFR